MLCEKPLGLNAEQAEEMVLVCGENNVNLGHATMMRFNGVHRKMREVIDSGAIGRPIAIHGRYVLWSTALADPSYTDEKIWQMPASSRPLIWRQTKRLSGGGPMMDLGIHVIDTMVFLVGHIKEVASFCDTFTHNLDVEDTASVLLKFENGAQAVLECYNSVANFRGRRSLGVFGEKGSLVAEETMGPPSDKNRLLYFEAESNLSVEVGPKEVEFQPYNMYQTEFQLFSEAVEAKKPYVIPGEEGLHIQRVLDAVYRSSEERRFISIDP